MTEKASFKKLDEQVPEQRFQRIESRRTGSGIADVWGGDTAIELKCTRAFPVRDTSPVVLDHPLSLVQHRWLNWRWRGGYKAFVLVQIKRLNWFLFAAPDAWCCVPKHEVPIVRFKMQTLWWSASGIDGVSDIAPHFTINEWLRFSHEKIENLRTDAQLRERYKSV